MNSGECCFEPNFDFDVLNDNDSNGTQSSASAIGLS